MVVLDTVLLILGMALIGVRLVPGLLVPIFGALVVRKFPEDSWDGAMMLFVQIGGALATVAVGVVFGLPWYSCAVAALVVGITSYSMRSAEAY